jgi:putative transposase
MRDVHERIPSIKVSVLCTIASVSRSGYYKWLKNAYNPDPDEEDYLLIKEIFDRGKSKWGWRTIQMKLKDKNIIMNHKKIMRIMNKYGLHTKIRRANPYKKIMKKTQEHRTFENVLNRQFNQTVPFTALGTDITYLKYNSRFAYLSAVKDFASGEIVAWSLSQQIDMTLVTKTLERLKQHEKNKSLHGALIHSDQGFHYTNPTYISVVKQLNMVQSMSRKGNCIDNASTESFFGHLKDEVDYKQCKTFKKLHTLIAEYMTYYNHHRHQWSKNKMTPVQYRDHLLASV